MWTWVLRQWFCWRGQLVWSQAYLKSILAWRAEGTRLGWQPQLSCFLQVVLEHERVQVKGWTYAGSSFHWGVSWSAQWRMGLKEVTAPYGFFSCRLCNPNDTKLVGKSGDKRIPSNIWLWCSPCSVSCLWCDHFAADAGEGLQCQCYSTSSGLSWWIITAGSYKIGKKKAISFHFSPNWFSLFISKNEKCVCRLLVKPYRAVFFWP